MLARAWEELYIAEGSDWFWWYGDDHTCAQEGTFDYLFRKHLQNVYLLLGDQPPAELAQPIKRPAQRALHTQPRAFLDVKIDGKRTFLEWMSAGQYSYLNERGSAGQGPIKEVHFGFTPKALLVRIDFEGKASSVLDQYDALVVRFVEPAGCEVVVANPTGPRPIARVQRRGEMPSGMLAALGTAAPIEVGVDQIAELSIPFERLSVVVDQPLQFFIELREGHQGRERAPRAGTINLVCPSSDFEQIMWDV